jgi:hypothetical protein
VASLTLLLAALIGLRCSYFTSTTSLLAKTAGKVSLPVGSALSIETDGDKQVKTVFSNHVITPAPSSVPPDEDDSTFYGLNVENVLISLYR